MGARLAGSDVECSAYWVAHDPAQEVCTCLMYELQNCASSDKYCTQLDIYLDISWEKWHDCSFPQFFVEMILESFLVYIGIGTCLPDP